uniref:Uncharacterized protein n=1 Tax=Arundo donax TaxID=35708 RepID=A0A0A9C207_ARUDO
MTVLPSYPWHVSCMPLKMMNLATMNLFQQHDYILNKTA